MNASSSFQRICLVHYHEIGLKGKNRSVFETRLQKNIASLLQGLPVVTVHKISGRLCVFIREGTDLDTALAIAELLKNIPGVARVSTGYKCARDLEIMNRAAILALSEVDSFSTFKVHARRNHTDFPTDSMAMNQIVGAALCAAFPDNKVKMKNPDVTVGVEVVQNASYVYANSIRAVGGLPVGSSGNVVALLSSGIDSPVALWRLARRGAVCIGVHFSGRPQTADTSEFLVDDIAQILEKSGCIARIYVIPFGDCQREIALQVPQSLRVIMYRRFMFRIAEKIALRENAGALVTGESLGQVASQTLDNIKAVDEVVSLPVFRPLIGTDKLEIITEAERLGTFTISSQDAPDCCTLFMPRNPETHAKLPEIHTAESTLPVDAWVKDLVESAEIHDYNCPAYRPRR